MLVGKLRKEAKIISEEDLVAYRIKHGIMEDPDKSWGGFTQAEKYFLSDNGNLAAHLGYDGIIAEGFVTIQNQRMLVIDKRHLFEGEYGEKIAKAAEAKDRPELRKIVQEVHTDADFT